MSGWTFPASSKARTLTSCLPGLATNPAANVAHAASVPAFGLTTAKKGCLKTSLKTSAAAILRRKKSYHSMVVPVALANATFLTEVSSRIS